jgi:hypothetical protein
MLRSRCRSRHRIVGAFTTLLEWLDPYSATSVAEKLFAAADPVLCREWLQPKPAQTLSFRRAS